MKFIINICCFFILLPVVSGQSTTVAVGSRQSEEEIAKIFKYRLQEDTTHLSMKQKAIRYNCLASCYQYYNQLDSVKYYLELSFSYHPNWCCSITRMLGTKGVDKVHNPEHKKLTKFVYFTDYLDEPYLRSFFDRCQSCGAYDDAVETKTKKHTPLDKKFQAAQIKDQQLRSKGTLTDDEWRTQHELDLQNRVTLDSIFNIHGVPKLGEVNKESQQTIWFVLQHSTDCEWNKKWFIRLFDAYQAGTYEPFFLDQTMKRFYHPETGFCKESTGDFIQILKQKYPKSYAKQFGYEKYE